MPAKKADWKTEPPPELRSVISIERYFTHAEMTVMMQGVIPEVMEDKWFIYFSENHLYFHRSWTGICTYVVEFDPPPNGWRAIRLFANRDPTQYACTDDSADVALLWFLIDVLLLHRTHVFPDSGLSEEEAPLVAWHIAGRAMAGRHPGDGKD
jgi:hypothetical protein